MDRLEILFNRRIHQNFSIFLQSNQLIKSQNLQNIEEYLSIFDDISLGNFKLSRLHICFTFKSHKEILGGVLKLAAVSKITNLLKQISC